MTFIRRLFRFFRSSPCKVAKAAGYTEEVLYAGWVDLPKIPSRR